MSGTETTVRVSGWPVPDRHKPRVYLELKSGELWECLRCCRTLTDPPAVSYLCGYRPIHICAFCAAWTEAYELRLAA